MTQEDKELLLKDLSGRLPYGVIGLYTWKCRNSHNRELTGNLYDELELSWLDSSRNSQFLPYLRPISSMTEEEEKEFDEITLIHTPWGIQIDRISKLIDWLNAHHFDYRGLIEKGLALEAPEGMYNLNK